MRHSLFVGLLFLGVSSMAQAAVSNCAGVVSSSASTRITLLPPLAGELPSINTQLGAPSGVLASLYDENQSVEGVLLRQRIEACRHVSVPVGLPALPNANDPAGYKPQTQYDNTPYRFNMTQNGKRMTADDFDAWLKSTGYSAGRRADPAKPVEPPAAAVQAAPVQEGQQTKQN